MTQIARASGVPRNKLYGALAQLEKMGLAETLGTEPLTYVTRSLSPFLQQRITRLESLLGELGDAAPMRTLTPVTSGAETERGASTWVP